jgi:hypothetical protein
MAVHVTIVSPVQKLEGASFVTVTPLQSSSAVATPMPPATQQPVRVTSSGQSMVGGVVSVTVIVCVQLEELPQLSVAVQVRVITESPAHMPGAIESLWPMLATPLQSSVAEAEPVLLGSVESPHSTRKFAGQPMLGPVVSVTVIVCMQLEELPQLSVAVQVRVITKLPAQEPGAVESL